MLLARRALWRLPLGRRRPERLTYAILFVVQAEVAWMALRTIRRLLLPPGLHRRDLRQRMCAGRPPALDRSRWCGMSWLALLVSGLTTPVPLPLR